MIDFVKKYGNNETSQNGENGIIAECLRRIKPELKVAVEFGAPTKKYCSNIYPLSQDKEWACYWFDEDPKEEGINKKTITPDNINFLPACFIISMDTDGEDYDLWRAYGYQPDIVVIEINSSLTPMVEHSSKEKGASYISMLTLGIGKGYFLLCHTGNLIFCLNKHRHLFPEIIGDGALNWEYYFNKSWL